MLFKPSYLNRFAAGMADSMIIYSRNGAASVLVIAEVVRANFYRDNLNSLVSAIQENLHKADFPKSIGVNLAEEFSVQLRQPRFSILSSRFFDYYWSRIPVLLKCNRVIHHGKHLKPTNPEIEVVARACYGRWEETYPALVKEFTFSGEYEQFDRLAKWYLRSKRRDDRVYSIDWLRTALQNLYPALCLDTNEANITTHVIESAFPMFWDMLRAHYLKSLFYYANLGWFVGDLDTEELCRQIEKPREESAP
jgi:hypothetical protein